MKPAEKSSASSLVKVQEDEVNTQLSVEENEINTEHVVEEDEINPETVDTREKFPDSDKYEDAIYRLGTNLVKRFSVEF